MNERPWLERFGTSLAGHFVMMLAAALATAVVLIAADLAGTALNVEARIIVFASVLLPILALNDVGRPD